MFFTFLNVLFCWLGRSLGHTQLCCAWGLIWKSGAGNLARVSHMKGSTLTPLSCSLKINIIFSLFFLLSLAMSNKKFTYIRDLSGNIGIKPLALQVTDPISVPRLHMVMVSWALPGVFSELRTQSTPWVLPGLVQKQSIKHSWLIWRKGSYPMVLTVLRGP